MSLLISTQLITKVTMLYIYQEDILHFPLRLHINPKVIEITKYFLDSKKILVSICYSVFILAATKAINGRKLYTKVVADIAGAQYEDTLCVVDGNLLTAVGNPGLIKMMEEFLKALK